MKRGQLSAPRNMGHAVTARPVSPMKPQWCTHRPGVNCVQANACTFWPTNLPCTSGFPSDNCRNQGPMEPLLHQGSQPTWAKPSRIPKKPPQSSARPMPRLSFAQTHRRSHPASSQDYTIWPALPARADTSHADPALTETAAPTPPH